MTMRTTEARPNVPSDEGKEREKFLQEMENGDRRSACSEKHGKGRQLRRAVVLRAS